MSSCDKYAELRVATSQLAFFVDLWRHNSRKMKKWGALQSEKRRKKIANNIELQRRNSTTTSDCDNCLTYVAISVFRRLAAPQFQKNGNNGWYRRSKG